LSDTLKESTYVIKIVVYLVEKGYLKAIMSCTNIVIIQTFDQSVGFFMCLFRERKYFTCFFFL